MLIGIAGKARSGKDELAMYLQNVHRFSQLAFADPVKEAIEIMFDIDIHTLEQAGEKEWPLPAIKASLRKLYQTLGTEWGREMIDKDIWIKQAARRMKRLAGLDVVISDIRFENEAEFIRSNGGHVIHIQRDSTEAVREHASENGIEFIKGKDLLINNNSTREALYDKAAQTLMVIKNEHCNLSAA